MAALGEIATLQNIDARGCAITNAGIAPLAGLSEGDVVQAGTLNVTARLRVVVEAAGEDTRLGQLMRRIEAAVTLNVLIDR